MSASIGQLDNSFVQPYEVEAASMMSQLEASIQSLALKTVSLPAAERTHSPTRQVTINSASITAICSMHAKASFDLASYKDYGTVLKTCYYPPSSLENVRKNSCMWEFVYLSLRFIDQPQEVLKIQDPRYLERKAFEQLANEEFLFDDIHSIFSYLASEPSPNEKIIKLALAFYLIATRKNIAAGISHLARFSHLAEYKQARQAVAGYAFWHATEADWQTHFLPFWKQLLNDGTCPSSCFQSFITSEDTTIQTRALSLWELALPNLPDENLSSWEFSCVEPSQSPTQTMPTAASLHAVHTPARQKNPASQKQLYHQLLDLLDTTAEAELTEQHFTSLNVRASDLQNESQWQEIFSAICYSAANMTDVTELKLLHEFMGVTYIENLLNQPNFAQHTQKRVISSKETEVRLAQLFYLVVFHKPLRESALRHIYIYTSSTAVEALTLFGLKHFEGSSWSDTVRTTKRWRKINNCTVFDTQAKIHQALCSTKNRDRVRGLMVYEFFMKKNLTSIDFKTVMSAATTASRNWYTSLFKQIWNSIFNVYGNEAIEACIQHVSTAHTMKCVDFPITQLWNILFTYKEGYGFRAAEKVLKSAVEQPEKKFDRAALLEIVDNLRQTGKCYQTSISALLSIFLKSDNYHITRQASQILGEFFKKDLGVQEAQKEALLVLTKNSKDCEYENSLMIFEGLIKAKKGDFDAIEKAVEAFKPSSQTLSDKKSEVLKILQIT